jgi:hypothetical protein
LALEVTDRPINAPEDVVPLLRATVNKKIKTRKHRNFNCHTSIHVL